MQNRENFNIYAIRYIKPENEGQICKMELIFQNKGDMQKMIDWLYASADDDQ